MFIPFFQSKAERKRQREQEIRRGMRQIRLHIKTLNKNITEFRDKAVEARRIGATDQLKMLTDSIKRSLLQMRTQERQLLAIETAIQIKGQAESTSQFALSMQAISTAIAESFGNADLDKTITQYEQATLQADEMGIAMDDFLTSSSEMLENGLADNSLVNDAEVQQMLNEDFQRASLSEIDQRIDQALQQGVKS